MKSRSSSKFLVLLGITGLVLLVGRCSFFDSREESSQQAAASYLNHSDTVDYVGIETCRQCHFSIYETYIHTGMGSSFGVADTSRSIASIDENSLLHDPHLNLYYHPLWQKDTLILKEFRLEGADTTYLKTQKIDYVVGSGQHTNSHIFEINGYLYQAPFTWYAQKGLLDLPPGFEGGANTRFSRKIGLECTSCHNSMPMGFVRGSINKYHEVPGAIDCERCHGPGELHVKRMQAGELVDTATETDYSIVNVKKLPQELQFEVCQRCHLQGNTVLAEGKSFLDFKPGMRLKEVMDIYLPRFSNSGDEFIMASHVDRFKQSPCVIKIPNSDFNCISCHNPHVSVTKTKIEKFNQTCAGCHKGTPRHECTAPLAKLQAMNFNCVECHMPQSTSIDIPHVTVHDHKIQVPRKSEPSGPKKFLELVAVNNPAPDKRSKAIAYLQQFEKFEATPFYLDSARYFLSKLGSERQQPQLWVQYHFLKNDYRAIYQMVTGIGAERMLQSLNQKSYDNTDGWTAYRIGEALYILQDINLARRFYGRAVKLVPHNPDFLNKYAGALASQDSSEAAILQFKKVLAENPYHKEALNNLGFQYMRTGDMRLAGEHIDRALAQDPDYEIAWLNKANLAMLKDEPGVARKALKEALRINPQNAKALAALSYLNQES